MNKKHWLGICLLLFIGVMGCQEEAVSEPTIVPTSDETMVDATFNAVTVESEVASQADADVKFVRVVATGENSYTFHVTVAHPDIGWEDYADGWDVVLPDETVVKPDPSAPFTRLLLHPHETEQPFTRSQSGVVISADVTTVTVRAHDLVHGFGGQEVIVNLLEDEGDNFKIER